MSKTPEKLDPQSIAKARRRLGFVAVLWWVAALSGAIGLAQGMPASWLRISIIGASWLLALFFSYAWWMLRREQTPE